MPDVPDLWGRVLTGVLGAVLPTVVAALLGVPALMRSRWEARQRQSELLGRIDGISEQIGRVTEAQHVAMRQQLCHNAEKYIERGWLTAEERKAWWEMYNAYDALGQNGYISSYWLRIQALPIREV